jgi:hypothetical protein
VPHWSGTCCGAWSPIGPASSSSTALGLVDRVVVITAGGWVVADGTTALSVAVGSWRFFVGA